MHRVAARGGISKFISLPLLLAILAGCAGAQEKTHALPEDRVLKEQVAKIQDGLNILNIRIAERKKSLLQETDETEKTMLNRKLEDLEKNRKTLGDLLRQLMEEQRAGEWTTIDEALKQVQDIIKRDRNETYQQDEVVRDMEQ